MSMSQIASVVHRMVVYMYVMMHSNQNNIGAYVCIVYVYTAFPTFLLFK
jgi:hypothetical protein